MSVLVSPSEYMWGVARPDHIDRWYRFEFLNRYILTEKVEDGDDWGLGADIRR